ncbi:hypothetical protein E4T44_12212 [Aureobasidium sp. EXF-8845]|nr:hypothetical protein E4T45_12072 [Aureobasidium sp. EXF-8846]KAI4796536.1 hypothetical protein E4T44_12212 [Aureobasidium sp. EXF-8845]
MELLLYMLGRAIRPKDLITDLIEEEHSKWDGIIAKNRHSGQPLDTSKKPSVLDDTLTSEDWQMLNNYLEFLQPLEEATMILQGHGKGGSYGVIWRSLDSLLNTCIRRLKLQLASHDEHGLLNKRLNYVLLLLLLLLPLYRKPDQQSMTSSVLRSIMGG